MNKRELQQAHVLRNYNEGMLSRQAAAQALGLSERQISRKAKEMKENGEAALVHKNTGRKPSHAISDTVKEQIIRIRRSEQYDKCNVSHFRELLAKYHGIEISYKALYNTLKEGGIESPKKHRKPTKAHRRRKRKGLSGELLQIDATPYEWFGGECKYALHGVIDDATGQLTGLYMTANECLEGYLEVMRQTILTHGVPLSVYSDQHTIFRSPKTAEKEAVGEEANLTQFGRALQELGINIIHARTPQAKGRIERAWGTLQSRLPIELRIRNIQTVAEANAFLESEYLILFNERFAQPPSEGSIFVPYKHGEELNHILCVKETRTTDNAGGFSFKGQSFKILDEGYPLVPAKAKVTVIVSTRVGILVQYKNRVFKVASCEKPVKSKPPKRKPHVPVELHTQAEPHLKHSSDEWKKVWHAEDYNESLAFLYDIFLKGKSIFA